MKAMEKGIKRLTENYRQEIKKLPWQTHQITLLMDGINVPHILPLLYANNTIKQFDVLYIQTRFQELKEFSPCLINLDTPTSYPIEMFLQHIQDEWGYVLASQAPWQEQIAHLKQLLIVKDQKNSAPILLKIADPLVIEALLRSTIAQEKSILFGPFSHILTYDIIDQTIINLHRPTGLINKLVIPYQLTLQESQALDQVDIKRANQQIYIHMYKYFPDFINKQENANASIKQLIAQAEQEGFTSVQEQLYYLNIHGYLGNNALKHQELANLIAKRDIESLKQAAHIAQQLAE